MLLESFLERGARSHPEKTALVCGRRRLSYRDVDTEANRLAHGLKELGVQRGDRVVICLPNSPQAVAAVFATLKAGGVFVMVNPTTKPDKLAYLLDNCRARAIVCAPRHLAQLDRGRRDLPHLKAAVVTGPTGEAPTPPGPAAVPYDLLLARHQSAVGPSGKQTIDIDLAALIYTSGSTGHPKGVMLTHANMVAASTSITTYLENTPDDIILNVLPLSFDYGLYQVLMAAQVGATVVLERSFTYPHTVLAKMVRERVTGLPLVPTMSAILLQMDLTAYDLAPLRYITSTGAALPTEHVFGLRRQLPHVRIYSMYGLTECKRVAYLPPEEIDRRPASVGKAMPNVEVYLVDDGGRPAPPGGTGQLVVRGSNVMQGYWERPDDTGRVLKPGRWPGEKVLHTGDYFRMDEDGYLYFLGRQDDIIKSRGEKVSPREVENVLYRHPRVAEAAVIGVPDPVVGQAVVALVAPQGEDPLDAKDLLRHCAAHLEDFMVPRSVHILPALPKTANGKIDKKQLAAWCAAKPASGPPASPGAEPPGTIDPGPLAASEG